MTPDVLDPAYRAFVHDMLRRFGFDPAAFLLEIAPDDEMFVKGVLPGYPGRPGAAFYRSMESAVRTHVVYRRLVEHLGGFGRLERVLDFGSGHGRLTRTLLPFLDRRRIWACDIYPNAVAWQAETFGVNGLVSVSDPAKFALTARHDIVFAGSVFSHLPDELFRGWLRRLYEVTAPRGLLAFSVHGAEFAPPGQEIGPQGIGYAGWSESDTLDPHIYGMSYVTEAYVREAVRDACGERVAAGMRVFPRALFESQDLYVVPGEEATLEGLDVHAPPVGSFRRIAAGEDLAGWAVDSNPGSRIVRVDLYVDDRLAETCTPADHAADILQFFPGAPNPPVAWRFPARIAGPDAWLRAELVSRAGGSAHCYARLSDDGGEAARS